MAEAGKSGRPWMVGALFCAQYVGLREGEVCCLKKSRIDRERLTIKIDTQRQYICDQGFIDRPVKGSSPGDSKERVIGVPLELIEWLDTMTAADSDYVLVNNAGSPLSPRKLCEMTPLLCEKAGLPMVGFHDLRSYAASNLFALEYDLLTISSILGHTQIDTTML